MTNDERKILDAEIYKLSPTAQEIFKKFFNELDKMKHMMSKIQDLPHAIWRDICDYEKLYQISIYGSAKSFYNEKIRILSDVLDGPGYVMWRLYKNGEPKMFKGHIATARTFIPNPQNKPQINHFDGDKTNNHVDNLEWVTPSENQQHAFRTGLSPQGENRKQSKLTDAQVVYVCDNPDGLTCAQLSEMFGVSQSRISAIQLGKVRQQAGGHVRESKHAKLTEDDIREIRRLYVKGSHEFGVCALAKRFGCSQATIWNILNER